MDAHEAFTVLLSKSFIRQSTSTVLLDKYEIWKCNEGARFWASRAAKLSTTRTAGELVVEGEHVTKELFRENRESAALSSTCAPTGNASLGIQLPDLQMDPSETEPYDGFSTTPPDSPPHVLTGTKLESSTLGMLSTVTLSSPRASSPTSASSSTSALLPTLVSSPTSAPSNTG